MPFTFDIFKEETNLVGRRDDVGVLGPFLFRRNVIRPRTLPVSSGEGGSASCREFLIRRRETEGCWSFQWKINSVDLISLKCSEILRADRNPETRRHARVWRQFFSPVLLCTTRLCVYSYRYNFFTQPIYTYVCKHYC